MPQLSPDGHWFWDGREWQPARLSPDGRWHWDGGRWLPVPVQPAPNQGGPPAPTGPAPAAGPAAPPLDDRRFAEGRSPDAVGQLPGPAVIRLTHVAIGWGWVARRGGALARLLVRAGPVGGRGAAARGRRARRRAPHRGSPPPVGAPGLLRPGAADRGPPDDGAGPQGAPLAGTDVGHGDPRRRALLGARRAARRVGPPPRDVRAALEDRAGTTAQAPMPLGSLSGSQPSSATAWRKAKRSVIPAT